MIGKTVSHYRITEKLGAGGMGEVYRAEDTNLNRQVAIKVLPDIFAGDPERLARFEREAKLLASLNHPNIGAIYGLEQAEGKRFLVLELIEGETLAQRIAKGPLPVGEALEVCRRIAEGLEAAHEKGIIHRDLKPANVKVTPEGRVKVLDFGLAKAFHDQPTSTESPTISEMTRPGVLLGTAAYMSPEQTKGKPVDKRTDIWAFGCVLYECLTGNTAFTGGTVTELMAAILRGEPDWNMLPSDTPFSVQSVIRQCLQKDLTRRLRDIGDARIGLDETYSPTYAAQPVIKSRWREVLPWILLSACVAVFAALIVANQVYRTAPAQPVRRFVVPLGNIKTPSSAAAAISPNGLMLVYAADGRLFRRPMDQLNATPMEELSQALIPFFSTNSEWVGFQANGKLIKILLATGAPVVLGDMPGPDGATLLPDDTIVYVPGAAMGLWRISSRGGERVLLAAPDFASGERSYRWPSALPDGEAVLFSMLTTECLSFDDARIVAFSLKTKEKKLIVSGGSSPHYAPTGHVVYARSGNLLAVPFDPKRLVPIGSAKTVLEGVLMNRTEGSASFDFSEDGTLVYIPGGNISPKVNVTSLDQSGNRKSVLKSESISNGLRVSPDGNKLAFTKENDVWIYDISLKTTIRITSDAGIDRNPVWSPDGQRISYASNRKGPMAIYDRAADGTGLERELYAGVNPVYPVSWSPDGKTLAFVETSRSAGDDVGLLTVSGQNTISARKLASTSFQERQPTFSPDGSWIAYISDEAGRFDVYVQSSKGEGQRHKISTAGGVEPLWSPKGGELFYFEGSKLMSAALKTAPKFVASAPRPVLEIGDRITDSRFRSCDVTGNPPRFFMLQNVDEARELQINIVLNWFEELKRLVPMAKK